LLGKSQILTKRSQNKQTKTPGDVVKPPVEMEAYDYRDQIPYIGVAIKN
jgi:hypothetical protein